MEIHKYANELFINEKYELANESYNILINMEYKLYIIYSNKAACFLKLKNYKSALDSALKSVQNNLNYSIAWGRIGYAYKGLKMFSDSLKAFEIAHKLNKHNEIYLKELLFLYERFDKKINMKNVFNLLLTNKNIFHKLKNIKNDITNLNNDNVTTFINEIMNEL
jgi:tetratricopeptide (TPR) repeat protein